HFAQRLIYDGDANGNNGMVVIPTAYDTFKNNDLRKSTWMLIGTQYQLTNPTQPVQGTEEYRGKPLSEAKYWSNDWIMYRLTDIYFYKAEALMRKNGGTAVPEALRLVNEVHSRAFKASDVAQETYTAATLTLPELLAERGRE
nr:hypothetical protein [Tanacetum cinerariifolium]